jgi:hypothetical protein
MQELIRTCWEYYGAHKKLSLSNLDPDLLYRISLNGMNKRAKSLSFLVCDFGAFQGETPRVFSLRLAIQTDSESETTHAYSHRYK